MLLSMDYFHDLKHFYKKSFGHNLAFEIASPLLQDLFRSMRDRIEGTSDVQGHFRFAHAETILPLASLLNLSRFDSIFHLENGHFRAETPIKVAGTRQFKGAALAPFAANVGFVLYECLAPPAEEQTVSYKVKLLLNEREVPIAQCNDEVLCDFFALEKNLRQWLSDYDFDAVCHVPSES